MSAQGSVWPDRLRIRDTGLHDDMGGLGQSVYTTAGQGYEKREYVRADLLASAIKERDEAYARVERLQRALREHVEWMTELRDTFKQHSVIEESEVRHINAILVRSEAALAPELAKDLS